MLKILQKNLARSQAASILFIQHFFETKSHIAIIQETYDASSLMWKNNSFKPYYKDMYIQSYA